MTIRSARGTPPFRGPDGHILPGSVAEARLVPLGGVEQWVLIRGADVANPPLVLLHGGPGFSETGMFRYFNAELEQRFTVVYWDQRGAGKSARPEIPRSSLTVEQLLADLDALVDHVRARLDKPKVTIFGHSWGSALGVLYCARHPEKVAAYVGCGQIGDAARGEALSYAWAVEAAERKGHRRALEALRKLGPPPHDVDGLFSLRTWVQSLDGQLGPRALWRIGRMVLGSRESSVFEVPAAFRAFRATAGAMWAEVSRLNLLELAPTLEIPVLLFLGRHDHFVPAEASLAWLDALAAPSKEVVWFEGSGHEPFMDEPASFNAAMVEKVLPVAAA